MDGSPHESYRSYSDLDSLLKEVFQTDNPQKEPIWKFEKSANATAERGTTPAIVPFRVTTRQNDDLGALLTVVERKLSELEDPYEDSNSLSFGSVALAEVYRQITGIKNYPQLVGHFRRLKYVEDIPIHQRLGFDSIPSANTLRKAQKKRFTSHTNERLDYWASHLTHIALNHGFELPNPDEELLVNNGGVLSIPIGVKRGYAHGALDLLRDDMPISKDDPEVALWTDYGKHFDFSLHLCDTGNAPEAELENFADNRGLQKGVDIFTDAETFRNDIYRVDIAEWQDTFDRWNERLFDGVFPDSMRDRYLPISVDATNIPTWASETADLAGVVGTEKLDNTHYAYQILSAQIVSDGMPFQIATELQLESRPKHEQVKDVLDTIDERGFNTGLLLGDADFATGRLVNELKGEDVDFVIAYPTHWVSKQTDEWEAADKTFGSTEYTINEAKSLPERAEVTLFGEYQSKLGHGPDDAQTTLSQFFHPETEYVTGRQQQETVMSYLDDDDASDVFEANNRMRWFTFITNLDVDETEARALREYYHYRWAIESAFSVFKSHFLPGTRSTNLGMRTYLYLFGLSAYNAWVAANAKARRQHLEDNERNRPPIRASRFTTIGQQRYRDEFGVDYKEF